MRGKLFAENKCRTENVGIPDLKFYVIIERLVGLWLEQLIKDLKDSMVGRKVTASEQDAPHLQA